MKAHQAQYLAAMRDKEESPMNIEEASEKMETARGEVATTAMTMADSAQHIRHNGENGYFVPFEDMKQLKENVKDWKAACAAFHLAVREAQKNGG